MPEPLKRTITLWAETSRKETWFEKMEVAARELKTWERAGMDRRFVDNPLGAEISWSSGTERTTQSTSLQPLNVHELRAFGVACIELACEMETAEEKKG